MKRPWQRRSGAGGASPAQSPDDRLPASTAAPGHKPPVLHGGFAIPHELAWRTGRLEQFSAVSEAHIALLRRYAALDTARTVAEIGCGVGRDAISLMPRLSPFGSYLGIDVMAPSIAWAQANITAVDPRFHFVHFDVSDTQHNPGGKCSMQSYSLPLADRSTDLVFLFSVFTHMFPADVAHYLHEFARILRPGGRVLASVFVVDDALRGHLAAVGGGGLRRLTFAHEVEPGFYRNDPAVVPGATAYSLDRLTTEATVAGLAVGHFARGGWSRSAAPAEVPGQDVLVLTRPD